MRIELIQAKLLQPAQREIWSDIISRQPALDSPFFTPEFTQIVAGVRQDVEVALLYESDRLAGFFPFQRTRWNVAVPVGLGFSEFHGVIAEPDLRWTVSELLRGCRVWAWKYDHLPVSQTSFSTSHQRVGASPYMNLADGYPAYCAERHRMGSKVIRQTARKLRKLRRDVGQVDFQLHDGSQLPLAKLLDWKSAQHARTGVIDVFRHRWVRQLVRRVQGYQSGRFSGVMSVLSAAGQPIAVHLGMRAGEVAHLWYPAYNPDFGQYSPGMILFLELTREFADQGVVRIDMGPGPQRYKQSLRSGDIEVAIGTADRFSLARFGRQAWQSGRQRVRGSVLAGPAKIPAHWLFQLRQWRALR